MHKSTSIVGDKNCPLSNRSSRQKAGKDIGELNSTTSQVEIIEILQYATQQQITHSFEAHMKYETFTKIGHILSH